MGLYACINGGVKFSNQLLYPDMIVMINSGRMKQCDPDYENDYFVGPPNFILEVQDEPEVIKDRKQLYSVVGLRNIW